MKIRIENNGIKATVEMPNYVSDNATKKVASMVSQLVSDIHNMRIANAVSLADKIVEEEQEETQQIPEVKQPIERPAIRSRIPNNVINIEDLSLKQAVTENALVRCPNCGQAHALIVRDNTGLYLMRKDYEKNEFVVISEYDINDDSFIQACCKEDTNRKAYFDDLQNVPESDDIKQFNVTNDTELFCPVCHGSNSFELWKDAFENPLTYFETEQLCDACGGEKLEKFIHKKKVYSCDKCGLITEFKEEQV